MAYSVRKRYNGIMRPANTTRGGFTVIEILVTIAIIGLLASFTLPRLQTAKLKAEVARAEKQVKQLHDAIELLAGDTREWPNHLPVGVIDAGSSGNEVWDLGTQAAGLVQTDGLFPNWDGPYLPDMPTDPWGNPYFFDTDYDIGTSSTEWVVAVGSFGPNGVGQNVYDSDNIISVLERE